MKTRSSYAISEKNTAYFYLCLQKFEQASYKLRKDCDSVDSMQLKWTFDPRIWGLILRSLPVQLILVAIYRIASHKFCWNQGTISLKDLGGEFTPKIVYFVLRKELLNLVKLCQEKSASLFKLSFNL